MDTSSIAESSDADKLDLDTARATFCAWQEKVWQLEATQHAAWLHYVDSGQTPEALAAFRYADQVLQIAQGRLGQARAAYRLAVLRAESGAV